MIGRTLKMMTMSKLRRLKPTRSRLTMATSGMATTVKGISTSSTRQLTVGMTKAVLRKGTPLKPNSRKGISNSRFRSLPCGNKRLNRSGSQQNKGTAAQGGIGKGQLPGAGIFLQWCEQ